MKVKITKTGSSANMEIKLLTEENTFTTLDTTIDTKLPWVAPCNLLGDDKIATLVKTNGNIEPLGENEFRFRFKCYLKIDIYLFKTISNAVIENITIIRKVFTIFFNINRKLIFIFMKNI